MSVTCVCSSTARVVFTSRLVSASLAVSRFASSISLSSTSLCSIDSAYTHTHTHTHTHTIRTSSFTHTITCCSLSVFIFSESCSCLSANTYNTTTKTCILSMCLFVNDVIMTSFISLCLASFSLFHSLSLLSHIRAASSLHIISN